MESHKPLLEIVHTDKKKVQLVYRFANNRGVSVVADIANTSYRSRKNLSEVAILQFTGDSVHDYKLDNGAIVNRSIITNIPNDVVDLIISKIASMPPLGNKEKINYLN